MKLRSRTRRLLAICLGLASATVLASCSSSGGKPSGSDTTTTITYMTAPNVVETTAIWVGMDEGFFASRHIKINYVNLGVAPQQMAALLGGSADMIGTGTQALWPYLAKKSPVQVLSAVAAGYFKVVARNGWPTPHANDPWPQPALDLKGATISVRAIGGTVYTYVRDAAIAAGLNPDKDLHFVALTTPAAFVPAFQHNRVDVIADFTPTPALLGTGNYKLMLDASGKDKDGAWSKDINSMIVAKTSWLQSHKSQALSFCQAYGQSVSFAKDPANEAKVIAIFEKRGGLDATQAKALVEEAQKSALFGLTTQQLSDQAQFAPTDELKKFSPDYNTVAYTPCTQLGI